MQTTMVPVARETKPYDFHLDLKTLNHDQLHTNLLPFGTTFHSSVLSWTKSNAYFIGNGDTTSEQIRLRDNPIKKVRFHSTKKKFFFLPIFNRKQD